MLTATVLGPAKDRGNARAATHGTTATGRTRRKSAQIRERSQGPASQMSLRISNSTSVGWELFGRAIGNVLARVAGQSPSEALILKK